MQNSIIFWPLYTKFLPMQLMSTETLNNSITIHGAKKRSLSSKLSLLKLFYFTVLQVDHTHDEKSTAALYIV